MNTVPVAREHLVGMLMSTVRRALGCASPTVDEACEIVRAYTPRVPAVTTIMLYVIERELRYAATCERTVGPSDCHQKWESLATWLRDLETANTPPGTATTREPCPRCGKPLARRGVYHVCPHGVPCTRAGWCGQCEAARIERDAARSVS